MNTYAAYHVMHGGVDPSGKDYFGGPEDYGDHGPVSAPRTEQEKREDREYHKAKEKRENEYRSILPKPIEAGVNAGARAAFDWGIVTANGVASAPRAGKDLADLWLGTIIAEGAAFGEDLWGIDQGWEDQCELQSRRVDAASFALFDAAEQWHGDITSGDPDRMGDAFGDVARFGFGTAIGLRTPDLFPNRPGGQTFPSSNATPDSPEWVVTDEMLNFKIDFELHGPYHRNLNRDGPDLIKLIYESQRLGGAPRTGIFNDIYPCAKAWDGPLPENSVGVEFWTFLKPSSKTGGSMPTWRGEKWGDYYEIPIVPTKLNLPKDK